MNIIKIPKVSDEYFQLFNNISITILVVDGILLYIR